jgi:hypothetical protein
LGGDVNEFLVVGSGAEAAAEGEDGFHG